MEAEKHKNFISNTFWPGEPNIQRNVHSSPGIIK